MSFGTRMCTEPRIPLPRLEGQQVTEQTVAALQEKVLCAGVRVLSVTLNELNYAPEIASAMLKKQQAGALVEAREIIAEGATAIALSAVARIEAADQGIVLESADKVKILSNILTVTCGEENATPVLPI